MPASIPQSTSYLYVFKLFLSSDHITVATGKTVAITISKNGGAFGNPSAGATNATEIASGWYKVTLSTTDTGTAGPLIVLGTAASCDPADRDFIVESRYPSSIRNSTAQAGAATTITLDASASATNDFYSNTWVLITGGTGAGQCRLIYGYNGTTKVATISPNWATNPDNTSTFAILPARPRE